MLSAVTLCLLASSARAQTVGVIVVGEPTDEAGRFQKALEEALAPGSAEVIKGDSVGRRLGLGDGTGPEEPVIDRAAVDRALREADAAYEGVEYTKALAALDRAGDLLSRAPHANWERVRDLHVLRTAIFAAQQRKSAARKSARQALLIDPHTKISLERFPPSLVQLVEDERKKNPPVKVALTDLPEQATVRVDGRDVPAPYQVEVTRGRHHLSVWAPGHRRLEGQYEWSANESLSIPLPIDLSKGNDEALKALIRDGKEYQDRRGIWGKGRGNNITVLVVGGVSGTGQEPVRRVAVWRLGQQQDSRSIVVRPTDGPDPFAVAAIQKWVFENVGAALRIKDSVPILGRGGSATEFHTVFPLDHRALLVEARGAYDFHGRTVKYQALNQGGTTDTVTKYAHLGSSGPGLWMLVKATVPARRLLLFGDVEFRFTTLMVNTEIDTGTRNVNLGGSAGGSLDAVARLGTSLRLLGGRLGLTPGLGYSYTYHYMPDRPRSIANVQSLALFRTYDRGVPLLSLGVDYGFRTFTFSALADVGPNGLVLQRDDLEDDVGTDTIPHSDVRLRAAVGWRIRRRWAISLGVDYEHVVYDVVYDYAQNRFQQLGLIPPAPDHNIIVDETNLLTSLQLLRVF